MGMEQEALLKVARRVRLLKLILIPLLPLSILGTYLILRYSYLLANAPPPLRTYADPVEGIFLIWSFYGLMIVLLAYYSRLQRLLATRQMILLAAIFIIYPILSYVYIVGLWLLKRQAEMADQESSQDKGPGPRVDESTWK